MRARLAPLAAALVLGACGALAFTAPASADVTKGHCTDDKGVTLVVDFQDIGGSTIVTCITDVEKGTSGLEILQLAGLSPAGTLHDGPSFVCRIAGRPDVNETLPLANDPSYRERCGQTPPKTAFWSYWHADNGGSWTFSSKGGTSRAAIPGGYEGWSFSLNRTDTTNPPPRVKPSHPVAKPSTPAPPAPSAAPTSAKPTKPAESTPKPTTQKPSKPTKAPTSATPTSSTTAPATPTTEPTPTPTAAPSPTLTAGPPPSSSPSLAAPSPTVAPPSPTASPAPPVTAEPPGDGVPVGTLVGAGAVAAIGIGGGAVWWRRRGL